MIHVEPFSRPPSNLPVSPLPSGALVTQPGVSEPHTCTHAASSDGHRLWYTASRCPGHRESCGLSPPNVCKGPSLQQINNLGKRSGHQPVSPLENLSKGSPLDPIGTKTNGRSLQKVSKVSRCFLCAWGQGTCNMNAVPPFLPAGSCHPGH